MTTPQRHAAATTFATDGLLRDDYTPKPAFAAYRDLISAFGQPTGPALASRASRPQGAGGVVAKDACSGSDFSGSDV